MRDAVLTVVASVVLGVGVPFVGMRMLAPSLAEGRTVPNFRGREVFPGLGIAWLLWAGAAIVAGVLASSLAAGEKVAPLLLLAGLLALVAFALGLIDDAYGTRGDRGFKGHLRALARGRLTTGGMKLLGISVASYAVATIVAGASGWAQELPLALLLAIPAGAAIALTANFVNLTDLRPGRALKVYSVLAVLGVVSATARLMGVSDAPVLELAGQAFALLLFVLGPVFAIWRYDVGEMGMLGDSGANAGGAVAGLLIVFGLPVWGMLLYLLFMLALNLSSERLSFTQLIEASPFLHRIDMLGRLPLDQDATSPGESSPQ